MNSETIAAFCKANPEEAERIAANLPDEAKLAVYYYTRPDFARAVGDLAWSINSKGGAL